MKIFLGSSRESLNDLKKIAIWIEETGHDPVLWNDPTLFLPGYSILSELIKLSNSVDAAIFLFNEDDKIWYRGSKLSQPRDNVLFEYGLFMGKLGENKSIICYKGDTKIPTDVSGIIYANISEKSINRARIAIESWINNILLVT